MLSKLDFVTYSVYFKLFIFFQYLDCVLTPYVYYILSSPTFVLQALTQVSCSICSSMVLNLNHYNSISFILVYKIFNINCQCVCQFRIHLSFCNRVVLQFCGWKLLFSVLYFADFLKVVPLPPFRCDSSILSISDFVISWLQCICTCFSVNGAISEPDSIK